MDMSKCIFTWATLLLCVLATCAAPRAGDLYELSASGSTDQVAAAIEAGAT